MKSKKMKLFSSLNAKDENIVFTDMFERKIICLY